MVVVPFWTPVCKFISFVRVIWMFGDDNMSVIVVKEVIGIINLSGMHVNLDEVPPSTKCFRWDILKKKYLFREGENVGRKIWWRIGWSRRRW